MSGTPVNSVLKTAAIQAKPQPKPLPGPVPSSTQRSIIDEADGIAHRPLWRAHTLALAADGTVHGDFSAEHVAFSPADVRPGSLYVARGELDAMAALQAGAAGCLSAMPIRGAHVRVDDIDEALGRIARAARNRSRATMTALAGFAEPETVTMVLHDALGRASRGMAWQAGADRTVASALCTLAADRNHALFTLDDAADARALRPHLLICGADMPRAIGTAMAATLQPGGAAVLPADSCDFAAWRAAALDAGAQVYGYGRKASSDIRLIDTVALGNGTTLVTADMMGRAMCWSIEADANGGLADPLASLAIMGAMRAAGASLGAAALALTGHREEAPQQFALAG